MNPEERDYTVEAYQIDVTHVYEKIDNLFKSKTSLSRSKKARILKQNIDMLYQLFREKRGIHDDFSHHEIHCNSIIDQSDEDWFTWFAYHLLVLPPALIILNLEDHYSKAAKKKVFLNLIQHQTMRFLSPIDISYFQSRINQIQIWVTNKVYSPRKKAKRNGNHTRISNFSDEEIVKRYFHQLSEKNFLKKEDVDHLIRANFEIGDPVPLKKFNFIIDKSHLEFFVHSFFKKYIFSQVTIGIAVSGFLINNFEHYIKESMDLKKEENLRKNFSDDPPKKYEFDII